MTTQNTVGEKHDQGKPQFRLLPMKALTEQAKVLTFGAMKYTPGGWREVPDAPNRYLDAAFRHLVAYSQGECYDDESGLPHLAHAQCCLSFLLELDLEVQIKYNGDDND